jgi:hypothetical protein
MLNLLQPDASRITPHVHAPTHDHAAEELALGTPDWLRGVQDVKLGYRIVPSRPAMVVRP